MGFWTFGSYFGKKRLIADYKSQIEMYESNIRHKIRTWKIAPQRIEELKERIAKLEREIAKEK